MQKMVPQDRIELSTYPLPNEECFVATIAYNSLPCARIRVGRGRVRVRNGTEAKPVKGVQRREIRNLETAKQLRHFVARINLAFEVPPVSGDGITAYLSNACPL